MFNDLHFYVFGLIQISQTGGQPYSDTSLHGECSLQEQTRPNVVRYVDMLNCPNNYGKTVPQLFGM